MRASTLSFTFLLTFIGAIFFLQWCQQPSYPFWIWLILGFSGFTGFSGFLFRQSKNKALILLTLTASLALSLFAVARISRFEEPPTLFPSNHPAIVLLDSSRTSVERTIVALYAEPNASLLIGLLTGSRANLDPAVRDAFRDTGLTHLIAISGYNITLVVTLLSGFFFWIPLRWRFLPMCLGIVGFTLFTGASASVVRAAIMGILSVGALHLGRTQTIRLTILWTLFCMLCWNPRYLWEDAGFQLSFLAIVGLTEITPLLDRWFTRVPDIMGMRQTLQTTVAVQIVTNPWICYVFGRLSLIAPLSNLLAPPLVPIAMLTGTVSLVLYSLWAPLGILASLPAYLTLQTIIFLAHGLAALPFASLDLAMSQWILIGTYIGIFLWWQDDTNREATTDTSAPASSISPMGA